MAKQVQIAVLGVGHLGRFHTMQLKEVAEANLVGIFDNSPDRAKEIGDEFNVNVFDSVEAVLEKVDAVSIVTPTTWHYELAKQALNAGKHVFIEKPMTTTLDEADDLLALAIDNLLMVQLGLFERFNPAIMALEPLNINPLFIAAHRMANFNPRGTDVAVVMDLMIHDIDLILSFVKSPVTEVHASGASIISPTEDIANCRLQFANGCVANVTASRISAKKMRKMRFFEPSAYVSVDFTEGITEIYHVDTERFRSADESLAFSLGAIESGTDKKEIRYTRLEKQELNPMRYELAEFCRAILNDTTPPVTGEEGRRALDIAGRILESIEANTRLIKKNWNI